MYDPWAIYDEATNRAEELGLTEADLRFVGEASTPTRMSENNQFMLEAQRARHIIELYGG